SLHPAGDERRAGRDVNPARRQTAALACALHQASTMQHTTPASLESIDVDALLFVSGGFHKHHCCCCCPPMQPQCIINMPEVQPQQVQPQQVQLPQTDPSGGFGGFGTYVSTSVSINSQPVGGQGTGQTAAA